MPRKPPVDIAGSERYFTRMPDVGAAHPMPINIRRCVTLGKRVPPVVAGAGGLHAGAARRLVCGLWLLCFCGSIASVAAGPKLLPVLNHPLADRSGLVGTPLTVNLAAAFGTEVIDDQVVRFTSQFSIGGVPLVLDMALFSNRTPVTRQNFLKYVADGDYVNSFIHRSMPDFVIQGGASRIINNIIESVPTDPPIVNEFGVSNTLGTISMAKLGGDPNSATSQWFVSLGANTDILDPQNGGFTVFGRITRSTFGNAQVFGNPVDFPTFDYGGIYTDIPMYYTHIYGNLIPGEFLLFPGVALVPLPAGEAGEISTLTFSVVSNSNPAVADASILPNGILNLAPVAGQTGNTQITVSATDSVGNTVEDSFVLAVNLTDTYAGWASRTTFPGGQSGPAQDQDADGWNNLQEYAFLGDPALPGATDQVVYSGVTGTAPAARYLILTFPMRKFTQGLSYAVEGNDGLSGIWTEVWNSTNEFAHAQVVSAVDQADRTVVTIKDIAALSGQSKRFLCVKIVQE